MAAFRTKAGSPVCRLGGPARDHLFDIIASVSVEVGFRALIEGLDGPLKRSYRLAREQGAPCLRRCILICSGVALGLPSFSNAAAPVTNGVAMEVPFGAQ